MRSMNYDFSLLTNICAKKLNFLIYICKRTILINPKLLVSPNVDWGKTYTGKCAWILKGLDIKRSTGFPCVRLALRRFQSKQEILDVPASAWLLPSWHDHASLAVFCAESKIVAGSFVSLVAVRSGRSFRTIKVQNGESWILTIQKSCRLKCHDDLEFSPSAPMTITIGDQ